MKLSFYKAFYKNATLLDNVIGIVRAGSYGCKYYPSELYLAIRVL